MAHHCFLLPRSTYQHASNISGLAYRTPALLSLLSSLRLLLGCLLFHVCFLLLNMRFCLFAFLPHSFMQDIGEMPGVHVFVSCFCISFRMFSTSILTSCPCLYLTQPLFLYTYVLSNTFCFCCLVVLLLPYCYYSIVTVYIYRPGFSPQPHIPNINSMWTFTTVLY